jgi:hypothetical protein
MIGPVWTFAQTNSLSPVDVAGGKAGTKPLVYVFDLRQMSGPPLRIYEGPEVSGPSKWATTVTSLVIDSRHGTLMSGGYTDINCWNLQTGE